MYNLGLSTADLSAYVAGLAASHEVRVRVLLLDMVHNVLADLTEGGQEMLLGGQVTVDADKDISRSASLELIDAKGVLPFDSNAPYDGALFMDRMIQIWYGVRSAEHLDRWVDCPIFTGPISKLNRTGRTVSVEALGKEWISQRPAWRTKNYRVGSLRTSVIRELLTETGETKFNLDTWTLKTANKYGITRESDVWALAERMAAGRLLYYNGAGTLVCRPALARPVYTFATGDGGTVSTDPQIDYQADGVRNIVWVVGGTPKGKKYPVQYTAYADRNHPMSAQSLGRNGKSRHLVEKIEDNDLLKESDCEERAKSELARFLQLYISVGFDAVAVPFLEEKDAVVIKTKDYSQRFGLDQFTIPLDSSKDATIGYVERRTANRAKIRRKR